MKLELKKIKNELDGKIIKQFVFMRPKTYHYSTDEFLIDKKVKYTRNQVIKCKKILELQRVLEKEKTIPKSQQRFRFESHNLLTEKANKITLSAKDW